MYQVTLEKFQGPIGKLLSLIEERALQITEVSLAKVTDDFFIYLRTLEEVSPALLADFVSVASKLILIKSKVLLPDMTLTEAEEAEIHELEARLEFYKIWKPAEKVFAAVWNGRERLWGRPYFLNAGSAFYPSAGLTTDALMRAAEGVLESLKTFTRETETVKESIIAIEEKIAEVLARLTRETSMSFGATTQGAEVTETIALFLAVLHLAREGKVFISQSENFSDIMITGK